MGDECYSTDQINAVCEQLAGVAKMTSHAIFQYNVLVIDIDNITLGLI